MASLPNAAYVGEPHFHSVNNEDAVYLVHPTTAKVVCMPASVSEEKLKAAADKYWYVFPCSTFWIKGTLLESPSELLFELCRHVLSLLPLRRTFFAK